MSKEQEKLNGLYLDLMRDIAKASYSGEEFNHLARCILFIWEQERRLREGSKHEA